MSNLPRLLLALTLIGLFQHAWIAHYLGVEFTKSELINLSFGVSYNIMNACLISLIALPFAFFSQKLFRIASVITVSITGALYYLDLQYVFAFRTHIPFSTVEYLADLNEILPSVTGAIDDYRFFLFCLGFPAGFWLLSKSNEGNREKFSALKKTLFVSGQALFIAILGGVSGGYANSNHKNIHNPLASSGLFYFVATSEEVIRPLLAAPEEENVFLANYFRTENDLDGFSLNYPLIRKVRHDSCENGSANQLGETMCGLKFKNGKPNIIFIFLESFRASDTGALGTDLGTTPGFDSLAKKGILFNRFFATGIQTRHGMLSGFCSLAPNYGMPVLRYYPHHHYDCLPEALKRAGYQTVFLQGGSLIFDNAEVFLSNAGFSQVMGEDDFDPEEEHLGWGYSDEATFEKLLETLDSKEQPFFSAMFTVTNHHPYELPDSYQSEGKSHGDKYFDALHYTSAQIHQFVEKAKKKDWYDETIIFILADTATNLPSKHHDTNFHKKGEPTKIGINHEEFINVTHRIPLLILGGKITEPFLFDRVSSQIDLAPTIADLIGLEGYTHWIGQSLLSKVDDEWAFVSRPKSYFAIIEDDLFVYADQKDDAFHFTFKGNPNPDARSQAQKFGLALIKSQRWLFQENKIWTESLSPRLGEVN